MTIVALKPFPRHVTGQDQKVWGACAVSLALLFMRMEIFATHSNGGS